MPDFESGIFLFNDVGEKTQQRFKAILLFKKVN